jgi:hypothetical protein
MRLRRSSHRSPRPSGRCDCPVDLDAEGGGVTGDRRQSGVGARLETRDLALARSHTFGDRDLGKAGGASAVGELARELAALEGSGDAQMDVGVVGCELVDERVEVVFASHDLSITQI